MITCQNAKKEKRGGVNYIIVADTKKTGEKGESWSEVFVVGVGFLWFPCCFMYHYMKFCVVVGLSSLCCV